MFLAKGIFPIIMAGVYPPGLLGSPPTAKDVKVGSGGHVGEIMEWG